jgi:hypothetical protein
MTQQPDTSYPDIDPQTPLLSHRAMYLMSLLYYRSGTMRIDKLVARVELSPVQLAEAIDELYQRWWIDITFRGSEARPREQVPENLRHIRRITVTHTGRRRYPVTWVCR